MSADRFRLDFGPSGYSVCCHVALKCVKYGSDGETIQAYIMLKLVGCGLAISPFRRPAWLTAPSYHSQHFKTSLWRSYVPGKQTTGQRVWNGPPEIIWLNPAQSRTSFKVTLVFAGLRPAKPW